MRFAGPVPPLAGAPPDARRPSANGSPIYKDAIGRRGRIDCQIVIGCKFILIKSSFRGLPFTGPVTFVVKGKHAKARSPQVLEPVTIIAQVFRIAMAYQQGVMRGVIGKIDG